MYESENYLKKCWLYLYRSIKSNSLSYCVF